MKASEVRALRLKHGLTAKQFGGLVYQTDRAVRNWEYGTRQIPQALVELLLWKLEGVEIDRARFVSEEQGELAL